MTFSFSAHGQTKYLPLFDDYTKVKLTVDSLLKNGIKEIIVFQTSRPFKHLKSADSLITFICWPQNDTFLVQIITKDVLYSPINFSGKEIFAYTNKLKTLVLEKEESDCDLKLIAPVVSGNVLFYFTNSFNGYFEQPDFGNPTRYSPLKDRERYRKKWYNLIYTTLEKENFNFKVLPNYNRNTGYK